VHPLRPSRCLALAPLLLALAACGPPDDPPAPAGSFASVEELAELREALVEERQRRGQLETQVAWLRAQIDALHAGSGGASDVIEEPQEPEAQPPSDPSSPRGMPVGHPRGKLWFDDEALLASGVADWEVERLREAFEESELAALELHHRAQREGWSGTGRYRQELAALRDEQRGELGEEGYDRMLYATGRRNRVEISDLLRGSPGEEAGFQPGDVVLSYGGRRIFDPRELKDATLQGRLGDTVAVDVQRGDQVLRFYVQRGPIGAKLKPTRQMPQPR
jgi:hypothetical protein